MSPISTARSRSLRQSGTPLPTLRDAARATIGLSVRSSRNSKLNHWREAVKIDRLRRNAGDNTESATSASRAGAGGFTSAHRRIAEGLSTPAVGSGRNLFRAQPVGRFACRCAGRFNGRKAPSFLTILTGRNLPKIGSPRNLSRRSSMKGRSRTSHAWSSRQGFSRPAADPPPADALV
jgi:hypothetical protein